MSMYRRENYEDLANAIVIQAVKDYRESWYKRGGAMERERIKRFFRSPFFSNITDVDPEYLIERLEDEHQ